MYKKIFLITILVSALFFKAGSFAFASGNSTHQDNEAAPPESVKLITDRDIYVSGDYLLFQALQSTRLPADSASGIFYLALYKHNMQVDTWVIPLVDRQAEGNIYLPDTLSTGTYQLVAFTHFMRNYGTESFFTKPLFIANRFDKKLENLQDQAVAVNDGSVVSNYAVNQAEMTDQTTLSGFSLSIPDTIGRREDVELAFRMNQAENLPEQLHIRIVDERAIEPSFHLWNVGQLQMMNHSSGQSERLYPVEHDAWVVSGNIVPPLPEGAEVHVVAGTPDTVLSFLSTRPDQENRFALAIPFSWASREVYLHLYPFSAAQEHKIVLDEKTGIAGFNFSDALEQEGIKRENVTFLQDVSRARIAWKISQMDTLPENVSPVAQLPLLFSKPNYSVLLSDYIPFDDMQDISREIIPQLRLRRDEQGQFEAFLIDEPTGIFLPGQATVFIDGIMSYGLDPLMHLNSQLLKRIDLHNTRWVYGDVSFHGVLFLHSKNKEYLKIVAHNAYTPAGFEFYAKNSQLLMPAAALPENIPDLGHVLYWGSINTDSATGQKIGFVTGDLPGTYCVIVSGLDENGNLVQWTDTFVVK